jgi:cobalamin-dependent methionine synthase I
LGAVLVSGLVAGCAGQPRQLQLRDGNGAAKTVEFPKGTFFGDISQEQVGAIAQLVAETNTTTAQRFDRVDQASGQTAEATKRIEDVLKQMEVSAREAQAISKRIEAATQRGEEGQKKVEEAVQKVETAVQKVETAVKKVAESEARVEETTQKTLDVGQKTYEVAQKTYDTTRMIIEAFEKVSRRQGTGELTVFYPVGSSRLEKGSLQYLRIIQFLDFLARESKGRKIMFVSVGSASATGPKELNEKLAKERSEVPLAIIDQYLINTPHEFVKIYGTGDAYSPKGVKSEEHQRYQHARLIAFFEKGQEPALPEPTGQAAPAEPAKQ